MARNRLTAHRAKTSGATVVNPGRFKDRKTPKHTRPIGNPYKNMTAAQKRAWGECVEEMPWLRSPHRQLLRLACVLAARMETGADMPATALQTLGVILSKLGATPVDETKINHDDNEDENPEDEFFSHLSH